MTRSDLSRRFFHVRKSHFSCHGNPVESNTFNFHQKRLGCFYCYADYKNLNYIQGKFLVLTKPTKNTTFLSIKRCAPLISTQAMIDYGEFRARTSPSLAQFYCMLEGSSRAGQDVTTELEISLVVLPGWESVAHHSKYLRQRTVHGGGEVYFVYNYGHYTA